MFVGHKYLHVEGICRDLGFRVEGLGMGFGVRVEGLGFRGSASL